MDEQPDEAEVLSWFDRLSNWGRWGRDDQAGTLNLIKPEHRVAAAQLVSEGRTVSCARDIVTAYGHPENSAQMYFVSTGQGVDPVEGVPATAFGAGDVAAAVEHVGLVFHVLAVTHIDSPSHLFWKGRMYNDRPAGLVTSEFGARWCAVTEMANGVVGRGVLLDVPRAEGVDALEPSRAVTPKELARCESSQNTTVGEGDIVLLRTGRWHASNAGDAESRSVAEQNASMMEQGRIPGWHAACMPWLHERGVAMIGADVPQDVAPPTYDGMTGPIHTLGLVAMGMPLIDNCDLEELAATCAELGRWEFQIAVTPLRIAGATGSPVNPVAVF
jgi:kynurenine formamidase